MPRACSPTHCKLYLPALRSGLAAAASVASMETTVPDQQGSRPTHGKLCTSAMLCNLAAAAFAESIDNTVTWEPSLLC